MCNFLRRPGDYGGTQSSGYLSAVTVDSSIPDVVVTYSTIPSISPSLVALRTFISKHPDEMKQLADTNPALHSILTTLAIGGA